MPATPSLPDVIRRAIESRLAGVHTAIPGRVEDYDPDTQTAEVMPLIKAPAPTEDGGVAFEQLPTLPNVPVLWPRTANTFLHLPLAAGDYVLLVFNEAAIGHWRAGGGEPAPPGDLSRHSLSYPYAIPGGFRDGGEFTIPDGYGAPVVVKVQDIMLVTNTGSPPAQFVALAEYVMERLNTIQAAFDAHVHPTGVGPSGPPPTPIGPLEDVASTTLKAE